MLPKCVPLMGPDRAQDRAKHVEVLNIYRGAKLLFAATSNPLEGRLPLATSRIVTAAENRESGKTHAPLLVYYTLKKSRPSHKSASASGFRLKVGFD